ncbi:unnamed protein product [Caenorhabditis bovis]|uniref:Uncharacterized protein n=1 Tax=Caenorhabditis bovis TaxID=2654633 RepID=A0A8S1ERV0_9PELO|nr:unnamed protein product [Caenorhabditis bovis]
MGKRAAKARRRAARLAAAEQQQQVSSKLSSETDCEIPTSNTKSRSSRIPVLKKGSAASNYSPKNIEGGSPSKIPRPVNVIYMERTSGSTMTSSDSDSIESVTGDELTSEAVTPKIKPVEMSNGENLRIIAESNGVEVELDMNAMVGGMNVEIAGIKIA